MDWIPFESPRTCYDACWGAKGHSHCPPQLPSHLPQELKWCGENCRGGSGGSQGMRSTGWSVGSFAASLLLQGELGLRLGAGPAPWSAVSFKCIPPWAFMYVMTWDAACGCGPAARSGRGLSSGGWRCETAVPRAGEGEGEGRKGGEERGTRGTPGRGEREGSSAGKARRWQLL